MHMSQALRTEKPRPSDGTQIVTNFPPDKRRQLRRVTHGVDRTGCRPPGGFDEDPLVPDSLSPVEGTAPPCRCTGTL